GLAGRKAPWLLGQARRNLARLLGQDRAAGQGGDEDGQNGSLHRRLLERVYPTPTVLRPERSGAKPSLDPLSLPRPKSPPRPALRTGPPRSHAPVSSERSGPPPRRPAPPGYWPPSSPASCRRPP